MSVSSLISFLLRPLLHRWSRQARPQTEGEIPIPGLEGTVKVLWGPHAVPHIFAASERDLFMAQGYVHAQERLWQMEVTRRSLSGRLAELFGASRIPWKELSAHFRNMSIADLDHFTRLMGLRRAACASLRLLSEEDVQRLTAYSEGVNRYIASHLKQLPVEFRLLRYEPEPWQAEDSLTIGKGFAFFLSTSFLTRMTLSAIGEKLKGQPAKLRSLFPTYPEYEPSITRPAFDAAQELLRFINGTFRAQGWSGGGQGSNNWVVGPERSATGKPILCNDPHLRLTLPCIWYLVHLQCSKAEKNTDDFEVWGGSIPGSPCVHLGHNRYIAWGVTAGLCDDADLFREKIHPSEPDLYLAGNEWLRMDCAEERIRIRRGGEAKKIIRWTRHGPVISDFLTSPSNGEVLALRWSAHEPSEEFRVVYGVNRARRWEEFLQSLSHQVAPTLNYVYADTQGNIGYSLAGKIPRRPRPHSFFPLPGWSGEFDWNGYLPFSELPRLFNPPEGVIATANNRVAGPTYPHYLSDLFEPPYRIRRIKSLLEKKNQFTREDMAKIQQDVVSLHAREIIDRLGTDLEAISREDPSLREAAGKLLRWDGSCSAESVEATLFHVFHLRLARDLLVPDLGEELTLAYLEIMNQPLQPLAKILSDSQSAWFETLPRQTLVQRCLREACAELTRQLGRDMEQWGWGKLHALTLTHPFSRSKILGRIFSLGPFPAAGDGVTINMGFYRYSDPFSHIVGPSLRMILPVGEWENCQFILPAGQSGNFSSPHYGDQTELWRRGDYLRLYFQEEEMSEWPRLDLVPV